MNLKDRAVLSSAPSSFPNVNQNAWANGVVYVNARVFVCEPSAEMVAK